MEPKSKAIEAHVYYSYTIRILGRIYEGIDVAQTRDYQFQNYERGPESRSAWAKIVSELAKGDFERVFDYEVTEERRTIQIVNPWLKPTSEAEFTETLFTEEED